MTNIDEDTGEHVLPEVMKSDFFKVNFTPSLLEVGAVTHVGHHRTENQDNFSVIRRSRSREILVSSVPIEETTKEDVAYMLMVADGLGGNVFGEMASRIVLQTAWNIAGRAASWLMKLKDFGSQQVSERVQAYLNVFQQSLHDFSEYDPRLKGMGTTLTVVNIMGTDAIVAHVGDSRAYLYRAGELTPMTHDQTVAARLEELGCSPEQVSQFQHVLYNCLSTDKPDVTAETHHITLRDGDRILLCTDGLTGEVEDEEISSQLSRPESPQEVCDNLLKIALANGGRDNITIIVADVSVPED